VQNLSILARLLLVRSSKSVTLGNRVAVKGTVEEGIEELFCEGRAPFDLWLF
jgi:urocanate hydratase